MFIAAFYFFTALISFRLSEIIYKNTKIQKEVRVVLSFFVAVLGIYLFYSAGYSVVEYRANR